MFSLGFVGPDVHKRCPCYSIFTVGFYIGVHRELHDVCLLIFMFFIVGFCRLTSYSMNRLLSELFRKFGRILLELSESRSGHLGEVFCKCSGGLFVEF